MVSLAVVLVLSTLCFAKADNVLYHITDDEYYQMPALFHLDEYERCLATRGVYCTGSFELQPHGPSDLFNMMQDYSANWVDNFNHTRIHRGLCLTSSCAKYAPHLHLPQPQRLHQLANWFEACVNETTMKMYDLSSRLYRLNYCHGGAGRSGSSDQQPLNTNERAFAGFVGVLLALTVLSTILDFTLPDHAKKRAGWALSWSLPGCWRNLVAAPPSSAETDLRTFDGLRVLCLMCVIVEHVCWITTQSYLADTRRFEQTRHALDAILMANSTLVVQIFFLMASFLLAHKLLLQRRRHQDVACFSTFIETMVNRIIRVSPSYFMVVWFAASWWGRMGRGPMWTPLIDTEVAICQKKWWTHLLYLNNILYADDKCLIQTWYLAADMQLYALALALTLILLRWRKGANYVLSALLAASISLLFGLAYLWRLVPTFVMHRPESVREIYSGEPSFNVLYQSPLGNAPGALAGLLLAHLHHALLDAQISLTDYKWFRWVSICSVPVAVWWVAASPLLLGRGAPAPLAAAALAAFERPIFAFFVTLALLGAMHFIPSPLRTFLSWRGWSVFARLSFGALLLHMPINKSLVAARLSPTQLDRQTAVLEWFGVATVSYLAALPLALLVEIPAQRLHRALTSLLKPSERPHLPTQPIPKHDQAETAQ